MHPDVCSKSREIPSRVTLDAYLVGNLEMFGGKTQMLFDLPCVPARACLFVALSALSDPVLLTAIVHNTHCVQHQKRSYGDKCGYYDSFNFLL